VAQWVRQNSAVKLMIGPAVATNGIAAVLTLKASTVTKLAIRKHGATVVVSVTGANMTHVDAGHYYVPLTSLHTNVLGHFRLYCRASGTVKSLPMWQDAHVVAANVYDSLVSGTDRLDVITVSGVWNTTVRTLTSGLTVANSVWAAGTKVLTSGLVVANSVWAAAARTLTSAGTTWTAGTRTLTSGLTVANSVWVGTTRTLTSAATTWTAGTRTLTSGLTAANSVWAAGSRTLTSAGTTWTAAARTLTGFSFTVSAVVTNKTGYTLTTGQHDAIGARAWAQTIRTLTSGGAVWAGAITEVTGAPGAAPTARKAMGWVYVTAAFHRQTTATQDRVYNSSSVVIARATLSASSTVFTRLKYVTAT